jgi:hypothetical protein
MDSTVDYTEVLEDLRAKRAKLDAAIEAIEQMAGQPTPLPADPKKRSCHSQGHLERRKH